MHLLHDRRTDTKSQMLSLQHNVRQGLCNPFLGKLRHSYKTASKFTPAEASCWIILLVIRVGCEVVSLADASPVTCHTVVNAESAKPALHTRSYPVCPQASEHPSTGTGQDHRHYSVGEETRGSVQTTEKKSQKPNPDFLITNMASCWGTC